MENKTDSSFERSIIFRVVAIIVCIVIAGSSFFGLAKSYSSPESKINKETIKYLDEKKTTALELSASATAVSTLITLAPGDDGTPVANKLMDLAGYFLIVVSAIYLEKYLEFSYIFISYSSKVINNYSKLHYNTTRKD